MKYDMLRGLRRARLVIPAALAVAAIGVSNAMAGIYNYIGPSGGNWSTAANWTSSIVPGSSAGSTNDSAELGYSNPAAITINFNYAYGAATNSSTSSTNTLGELDFRELGGGPTTLIQSSSSSAMAAAYEVFGQSSGFLMTYNQSNGSNTVQADLDIGLNSADQGAYFLSGGTLNVDTNSSAFTPEYIGQSGTGSFIQSGGSHTINTLLQWNEAVGNGLYVGYGSGATGSYILNSNTATASLTTYGDEMIGEGVSPGGGQPHPQPAPSLKAAIQPIRFGGISGSATRPWASEPTRFRAGI
jgi:hypothetical protein